MAARILRYGIGVALGIILVIAAALAGLIVGLISDVHNALMTSTSLALAALGVFMISILFKARLGWAMLCTAFLAFLPGSVLVGLLVGSANHSSSDGRSMAAWVLTGGAALLLVSFPTIRIQHRRRLQREAATATSSAPPLGTVPNLPARDHTVTGEGISGN